MSAILGKIWNMYKYLFCEIPDKRTVEWFLVGKPYQCLAVLGLYLMFVFKWGPQFMKGRPAYNLDKIMIVYNILQVLGCFYIFYYSIVLAWGWHYKWICEPVDTSNSGNALEIAKTTYLYFLMKIVDLLDTIFFVLRKKSRQVSFLHIYHHTGMVLLIWGAVTYIPGGHGTLIGVINTFVHIVMYSYYLYTVVNPTAKQSVWWKKYITQLQIVQFFWCVVHMLVIVFKPDCEYPRWVSAVFIPQNIFILVLFIDFYIKNYIKRPHPPVTVNSKLNINASINDNVHENDLDDSNTRNQVININKETEKAKIENGVLRKDQFVIEKQFENGFYYPDDVKRFVDKKKQW